MHFETFLKPNTQPDTVVLKLLDQAALPVEQILPIKLFFKDAPDYHKGIACIEIQRLDLYCPTCNKGIDKASHKVYVHQPPSPINYKQYNENETLVIIEHLGACHDCKHLVPAIIQYSAKKILRLPDVCSAIFIA